MDKPSLSDKEASELFYLTKGMKAADRTRVLEGYGLSIKQILQLLHKDGAHYRGSGALHRGF